MTRTLQTRLPLVASIPPNWTGAGAFPYQPELDAYAPATYRRLPDYSRLLPPAEGRTRVAHKSGGLEETLVEMKALMPRAIEQVTLLAGLLKANNLERSAYNVWHWLKMNIVYKLDRAGHEELRLPARSYADRVTGIDCDDYAIFAAALLARMGYSPHFEVVAFSGKPNFSHIYVIVSDVTGRYAVDPVLSLFQTIPPNVSKAMQVDILSGVDGLGCACQSGTDMKGVDGLGNLWGPSTPQSRIDLWAAQFKNTPEEGRVERLKPLLADVTPQGQLVPIGGDYGAVMQFLTLDIARNDVARDALSGLSGLFDNPEVAQDLAAIDEAYNRIAGLCNRVRSGELDGLTGFGQIEAEGLGFFKKVGNFFKKVGSGIKNVAQKVGTGIKNVAQKVGKGIATAAKKVGEGIKKAAGKAWEFIKKVNPLSVIGRNAFLLLVKLNVFGLATKLSKNPADKFNKMLETWKKWGGDPKILQNNINQGKGKKPVFAKDTRNLKGLGEYVLEGLGQLGEPISITAALGAAAALIGVFKQFFGSLKSGASNAEEEAVAASYEATADAQAVSADPSMYATPVNASPGFAETQPSGSTSGGKGSMTPWLIGAAALGLVFLMAKK